MKLKKQTYMIRLKIKTLIKGQLKKNENMEEKMKREIERGVTREGCGEETFVVFEEIVFVGKGSRRRLKHVWFDGYLCFCETWRCMSG
jgi:hypothetical protein